MRLFFLQITYLLAVCEHWLDRDRVILRPIDDACPHVNTLRIVDAAIHGESDVSLGGVAVRDEIVKRAFDLQQAGTLREGVEIRYVKSRVLKCPLDAVRRIWTTLGEKAGYQDR